MIQTLFEDKNLLVINKRSGISLLRDRSGEDNLWTTIKDRYPSAKTVHRLDKGTSGVLLVALSREYQKRLNQMFANGWIRKYYVGITAGHFPSGKTLVIKLPLKKGRKSRYRIAGLREQIRESEKGWNISSSEGLGASSRVRTLKNGPRRSLVLINPLTGRTHQIRVHLSWVGHAIVGDQLYGSPNLSEQSWTRLALHCHRLVLPGMGTYIAPIPEVFLDGFERINEHPLK